MKQHLMLTLPFILASSLCAGKNGLSQSPKERTHERSQMLYYIGRANTILEASERMEQVSRMNNLEAAVINRTLNDITLIEKSIADIVSSTEACNHAYFEALQKTLAAASNLLNESKNNLLQK